MKTKLTKLCLEIGGSKIELTPEQAKELKAILNEVFQEPIQASPAIKKIIEEHHYHDHRQWPYSYWSTPTYTIGSPYSPKWKDNDIICLSLGQSS